MRKITSFLSLILVLSAINISSGQITSYPYTEDFESGDGGWVADNTTNGSWALGAPTGEIINSAASGTNAWVTNLSGNYNINENSWVTSPVFDLSSLSAPAIELSIWYDIEFSWDGAVLQSSIDSGTSWQNVGTAGDPNNWYTDNTINGNPGGQQEGWSGTGTAGTNAWVIAKHTLTGLAGESNVIFRIAFGSDGSTQNEGFAFDYINIFDVTCPEPIGLMLGGVTENSAEFTWQQGGSETSWEIAIQAQGTGVPIGNGVVTSNNDLYVENNLTPSTAYEVYIRTNCGDEFSSWVGPLNFTTLNTPPPPPNGVTCTSGSTSFIFTEDFEAETVVGWTGTIFTGNNGDWDITDGNANSDGTGPNVSYSGNMHLEYEASGNATDIASAISPAIDLTTATDGAELSFFMHAFGDDMGILNVGIANDPVGPFTNIYSWNGDFQVADTDVWVPIGINLDAYLGQVVYIEFSYGAAGTGFEGDMSIDFIRVEACGDFCLAPSSINVTNVEDNTVDFDWIANNGENEWEYVIQPAGTGEPTGNGTVINTTSVNLNDLNHSTYYEIYVRAVCGDGFFSLWTGPVNFTTDLQTEFVVDCANGVSITNEYCYQNNDDNIFTFTSNDGDPVTLAFNSGNIENYWDELIVYDSDGVTELYNGYGNAGDLTGLTFQSTGDTISFIVNADASVSCEISNSYNPINYTVGCENYGHIIVNAFMDNNANGIFDVDEVTFENGYFTYEENNDGVINTVQSSVGSFSILSDLDTNTYDFNYYLYDQYLNCYSITTVQFENISVTQGELVEIDFPIIEDQLCEDIGVYLTSDLGPVPGMNYQNVITISNHGFATVSGTVSYTLDNGLSIISVSSGSNYITTNTGGGLTIDFTDIQANESIEVIIDLETSVSLNIEDLVTNIASYTTSDNDVFEQNNSSTLTQVVSASYDPNDKMESHGPRIIYDDFITSDEYLYYTIRFQNIGTAPAVTVRIEDILDAQLDATTFQMLRASHDYVVTRVDQNLVWNFEAINLPAEQDDAEGSNGFVYFRIKPQSGYAVGDLIPNTASIYFDFNAPIITNIFNTEFVEVLSVEDIKNNMFIVYPNPTNDVLNISAKTVISTISIYDLNGRLLKIKNVNGTLKEYQLDVQNLSNGVYFLEIDSGDRSVSKKFLKN